MESLSEWDWALLAVSVYVALTMLVRLMCRRRESLVQYLSQQLKKEKRRRESQEASAKQASAKPAAPRRGAA